MKRLLVLLCSISLFGQVQEEITVKLRDIKVHVVDKNGKPVTGLTAADFLVKEGKKTQELSYFEEVDDRDRFPEMDGKLEDSADNSATAIEGVTPKSRAMVLFIDTSVMSPESFTEIMHAAREIVLNETERPGRLKIVHLDKQLRHLTDFTNDRDALLDALNRVKFEGSFRTVMRLREGVVVDKLRLVYLARTPEERELLQWDLDRAVDDKELSKLQHYQNYHFAMKSIGQTLAAFPDSKSIFLLTGGIYLQDGAGAYVNTRSWSDELAKGLNQSNITVYAFLQTDKKSYTYDLAIAAPQSISGSRNEAIRGNSVLENEVQIQTGAEVIAHDTGGYFTRIFGNQNIADQLIEFNNRTRHYYRLVYTVDEENSARKIKVELAGRRSGLKVLYGERFGKATPFAKWTKDEKQINFESNLLYSERLVNELDCKYGFSRFIADSGMVVVPVSIRLPVGKMPTKGYEIGLAAFAEDGYLLDILQSKIPRPPVGQGLRFYHVLVPESDPAKIRVFIRNLDDGTYSVHEQVFADPLARPETLCFSEVVLSQADGYRLVPLNHLEGTNKKVDNPRSRKDMDPLLMGGYVVAAGEPAALKAGQTLDVFCHFRNLTGDLSDYEIGFFLKMEDETLQIRSKVLDLVETEGGSYRYYGRLDIGTIKPGNHQLLIQIQNPAKQEAYRRVVPLTLGVNES